jgi:ABC-type transport system involved in multi-copper enzyme maturation permease subunit
MQPWRRHWLVLPVWVGFCLLLSGYNLALYPYFTSLPEYTVYLTNLPEWMRFIVGYPGQMDISNAFMALSTLSFTAPLIWLALVVGISLDETAGAEESGHLTFLLIHPIKRWCLFLTKALAILSIVLVMGLIFWGCLAGVIALGKIPVGLDWLAGSTLHLGLFVLLCSGITMVFGALSGRMDLSSMLAGGVILLMWLVEGCARLGRIPPAARWFNPYSMLTISMVEKTAIMPWILALMTGLILISWAGGVIAWQQRSIYGPSE